MYAKKRPLDKEDLSFKSEKDIIAFSHFSIEKQIEVSRAGISRNQIDDIRQIIDASYRMITCITGISSHSITTKKGRELLSPRNSEAIVQMLTIYGFGYQLFGKYKAFNMLMHPGCMNNKFGKLKQLSSTFIGRARLPMELLNIKEEYSERIWEVLNKLDPIPVEIYREL